MSHRDPSVPVWAGLLHKDPNIPVWSPHTPGRCPSVCPPTSQGPRGPSTGPSISHRDPDVPAGASNNPEKPRCPDLVSSHPREVAQLGSPRTRRTPGVLVRTPQYPRDPNVLVRSPQGPSTPEEPPVTRYGPIPTSQGPGVPVRAPSIHHKGPDVPARAHLSLPRSASGSLEAPNPPRPPRPLTPGPGPGPGPHSPPGSDHLTARRREVDHPICAGDQNTPPATVVALPFITAVFHHSQLDSIDTVPLRCHSRPRGVRRGRNRRSESADSPLPGLVRSQGAIELQCRSPERLSGSVAPPVLEAPRRYCSGAGGAVSPADPRGDKARTGQHAWGQGPQGCGRGPWGPQGHGGCLYGDRRDTRIWDSRAMGK